MESNHQFDDNGRINNQGGEGSDNMNNNYGGGNTESYNYGMYGNDNGVNTSGANGTGGYNSGYHGSTNFDNGNYNNGGYNNGSNNNSNYGNGGYNNGNFDNSNYDNGSNSGYNYSNFGNGNGAGPGFESGNEDPRKKGPGRIIAAIAGVAIIGAVVCAAAWGLDKNKANTAVTPDRAILSESTATTEAATTEADTKEAVKEDTDSSFGISRAGDGEVAADGQESADNPPSLPQTQTGTATVSADGEKLIESTVLKSSGLADVSYTDAVSVVEHDMPAIVSITSTVVYQNFSQFGYNPFGMGGTYTATGSGSGVIIGDNGTDILIVTNNHVVADSDSLTVTFCNETTADAAIKGTSANNDLAVVAVPISSLDDSTLSVIRAIEIGDSDSLVLGQRVIAIGNALGLGQSVTTGVISATSRQITTDEGNTLNLLQTDAAINPGNSGGALLDASGRLIGINVAKSGISGSEGVGFAIPITGAKSIITELMNQQTRVKVDESQYPYLGVKLQDINSSIARMYNMPVGIMIYSLEPDSPAEKAGIRKNDIITKFDGQTVSSYSDLSGLLPYYAGGTTVDITVQRFENGDYSEVVVPVTLGLKSDYSNQR